jgi:hypothetical protein
MSQSQEQLSIYTTTTHPYATRAHDWIMADPKRFRALQDAVLWLWRQKQPIQQGRIQSMLAPDGYGISDNDTFAHDRCLWPALSRYLRALYPCLKSSLHIRKSELDDCWLEGVPRSYTLPGAVNVGAWLSRREWQ